MGRSWSYIGTDGNVRVVYEYCLECQGRISVLLRSGSYIGNTGKVRVVYRYC